MTETLIVYHGNKRYHLNLEPGKRYELSNREGAQLVVPDASVPFWISLEEGEVVCSVNETHKRLPLAQDMLGFTFYLAKGHDKFYDPLQQSDLLIGQARGAHIYIENSSCDFLLSKQGTDWQLTVLSGQLYVNNVLNAAAQDTLLLQLGDELAFKEVTIKVYPDELKLSGEMGVSPVLVEVAQSKYGFYEGYPEYHRSPRVIYRSSEDKITLNAPASEPNKPKDELLKLIVPPLLMVGVTVLISIFQPRGLYIIATIVMSVATMIFSIHGYFKNRKQYKLDLQERMDSYHHYLSDKAVALNERARAQKDGQLYHFPTIETLDALAQNFSPRIYEKNPLHFDFLYYRLGLGEVPASYNLVYSQQERSGKTDDLEAEGYALYRNYLTIPEMPIVANLSHGPVGYIGPRPLVLEQLQLMVNQLVLFHSYHDVQLIAVMPEEEREQWDWMRWLPHARLQELNVRGFVYNQRTRDQVLGSLNQILRVRHNQLEDKTTKEGTIFSPHYVVLVTDEKLILDHVIMEFFTEDPTRLGCSLVFVQDVMSSLSENVKTIINIRDRNVGQLVMEEGTLKERDFALDHFPQDYDKERIARRLAPLKHLQNLKSSIPETVTFMELYGVDTVAELNILERWQHNSPYKSLAVPLGLRGQGDTVYLNLHEKAHGPHGLVAGTTGSGKSEIIQSYILSLAVNFHPHDVAFLLIDYKGGGMANLFKDLPHLLGTITNLDGAQSMRALVSINAELKRRQRLFAEHDVNHINQYQKKYKLGEVSEPLPHLFLISDEFAELKANQPDFMTELVSTARIGRSLGIHLILATQKPSGVVNDQIWSNARFKLALKVADRQDSQEMIKTPDAANISQPGRAYLQVGNNEVYELFQSAWSGADYQPEKDDQGIEDHTIYAINDLGQYEVLNEDLSGLEYVEDIRQVPTELDVVVTELKTITETQGIVALPQPWLPPLKERIYLEELTETDYVQLWPREETDLSFTLGMADMPQKQKQESVVLNLSKDGNILLYGSPGSGKTAFLQSMVMDLARHYNPETLHFYLLDFGSNGLASLMSLPHVADTILLDQDEKLSKFLKRINQEIARRKKLLSNYGVGNLSMYRQVSGKKEPSIVVVLDSFESVKEEAFEDELFKMLIRISREGLSIGLHLVMTAIRQANLRAILYSNFKHQLTLPQHDVADVRSVVGNTPLANMDDIKGRALYQDDEVNVVQLALASVASTDIRLIEKVRDEALAMKAAWTGVIPASIPMAPDELTTEAFYGYDSVQSAFREDTIPLGLDVETVDVLTWNLKKGNLLYLSDQDQQLSDMAMHLLEAHHKTNKTSVVFAPAYHNLPEMDGVTILTEREIFHEMIDALEARVQERLQKHIAQHDLTLFLYSLPHLIEQIDAAHQKTLTYLIEWGYKAGYGTIVLSDLNLGKQLDSVSKAAKGLKQAILAVRLSDQAIVTARNKPLREATLGYQVNYYIQEKHATLMKVVVE